MIDRIFKNQLIYLYFILWTAVAVVHFLLLNQAYQVNLTHAVIDSLVFNFIFCLMGIGLWFMAEYSEGQDSSRVEMIIRHVTFAALSITIWLGAGRLLIKTILGNQPQYISFLDDSILMRVFTGVMYYSLLNAFFYLLISYRQLREKKEFEARLSAQLREAELNMLRSQIRPHFLFNSLNSISALTLSDPEKAHEMIIKLSDYMRYSLTFQGETMSTLEKELYHVRLYLDIEKIRFGEKLKMEYNICMQCQEWKLPAMILQPVIENAVKYGVYESTEAAGIVVNTEKKDTGYMVITIINPYDAETPVKKGTGTGLSNIRKRLETVYKQPNLMTTSAENNIFTVQLSFPYYG